MILIWSGEGGPLQYLGLFIFALQFFAPQLFRFTLEIQHGIENGSIQLVGGPSFETIAWIGCSLAMAIFFAGLWVVWDWYTQQEQQQEQQQQQDGEEAEGQDNANNNDNGNRAAAAADTNANDAPIGSAANPVVIDDDNNDEYDGAGVWTRARRRLSSFTQSILSPTHLMLAAGIVLPLAMSLPLLLNGIQPHGGEFGVDGIFVNWGVIQVTILAIIAHSIMAIAAYRVLRDVLDGGAIGQYPGMQRGVGGRRRRGRKLTVGEIAEIVRKVPVEEFVSEEALLQTTPGECSIAKMKRMLVNRGAGEAADMCLERDDLVNEIRKVRKFNEECAICAEEYIEGDILRIPHCQHEFHLHCFDKWIYTFSTDSRPATHPTCPLCKATIQ